MQQQEYDKISFLITITPKYTLSLKNTLHQIYLTLPFIEMHIPTTPLDNHC